MGMSGRAFARHKRCRRMKASAERSPLAASERTTYIDWEGLFLRQNLQNRPDPAGQLHGVVSLHSVHRYQ